MAQALRTHQKEMLSQEAITQCSITWNKATGCMLDRYPLPIPPLPMLCTGTECKYN